MCLKAHERRSNVEDGSNWPARREAKNELISLLSPCGRSPVGRLLLEVASATPSSSRLEIISFLASKVNSVRVLEPQ